MSLISKQETCSLLNKQFKVEYGRKLGSKQETLPLLSNYETLPLSNFKSKCSANDKISFKAVNSTVEVMELEECPNNMNMLQWEKAMKKLFRKMPASTSLTAESAKD